MNAKFDRGLWGQEIIATDYFANTVKWFALGESIMSETGNGVGRGGGESRWRRG